MGVLLNVSENLFCKVLPLMKRHVIKCTKYQEIKFFLKKNEFVLSQITIYLEDDNQKPVHFNGETINFSYQKIRI